ncbi:hypothetical protein [Pelagibacterium halotolerans]|uniref:Uncharacterized protein n=1 Tax=Pelagibacterium halotolerans (strain DSM 22347 / JCM 15775 / CGMCC 1.7692 / B2) TaxID=1082931 RepID=G4REQ3_PELHB|nr:hypothetical protein KKY_864 [Pelagibacterium halotolerans B2]
MAKNNGKTVIPLEKVRRDFFSYLTLPKFSSQAWVRRDRYPLGAN